MSIQLRPDVPLAVLSLCFAYALGRALQTRAPGPYVAAAVLAGFASMTKLHALGLIAPVLVAAFWRPPEGGWRRLYTSARERPVLVVSLGVLWLALALYLNGIRVPFTPTAEQTLSLLAVVVAAAAALGLGLAVRLLRPLALVGPAFVAGLLLPVTVDIPDGLQALVIVAKTVMGRRKLAMSEAYRRRVAELHALRGDEPRTQ